MTNSTARRFDINLRHLATPLQARVSAWLAVVGALLALSLFGFARPAAAQSSACTPQAGYTNCVVLKSSGADQTVTNIPAGAVVDVKVWGAGGGGGYLFTGGQGTNFGGPGGYSTGIFTATGAPVYVVVGEGGNAGNAAITSAYGGGGAGGSLVYNGTGGGGLSGVFYTASPFANPATALPLVVAGGGGGGDSSSWATIAGAGGGAIGGSSQILPQPIRTFTSCDATTYQVPTGGTQSAGGTPGVDLFVTNPTPGTAGTKWYGGTGATSSATNSNGGGGSAGGGGGYFGGGGGTGSRDCDDAAAAGGSGFLATSLLSGSMLQTTISNPPASSTTPYSAPNTSDPQYIAAGSGFGAGGKTTAAGGNGLVVLQWYVPAPVANPDTGSAAAGTASTPIANVASNDLIGSTPVVLSGTAKNVTLAVQSGTTVPTGLTFNTTTGAVSVASTVAPGTYVVKYTLCNLATPTPSCVNSTATVTVATAIVPVTESGSGFAYTAATPIANVRSNDTVGGAAATASNSAVSADSAHPLPSGFAISNATGAISVDNTVAAGTYAVWYQLCDTNTPASCATMQDTVTLSNRLSNFSITKSNGTTSVAPGQTTTYTLVVTNQGSDPASGIVVKDTVGAGLTCPAGNVVTITGSGVPGGSFTMADLTGAGITLGTLSVGQSSTLTYACVVS